MPKTIKYHKNKRGGFLENFTKSMNSHASNISNSSKSALDTINKSASDTKNSIGNFFSSGYNKVFGNKNSTSSMPYSSSTMPSNTMPSSSSSSSSMPSSSSSSSMPSSSIPLNNASQSSNILSNNYSSSLSGGRKHRRTRKTHRGGKYVSNTILNNIASNASPINGINAAKPCSWVGGKKKSRKSRKSRKTKRSRK